MRRQARQAHEESKKKASQEERKQAEQSEQTLGQEQKRKPFSQEALQEAWVQFFKAQPLSQAERTFFKRKVSKQGEELVQVRLLNIIESDILKKYEDRVLAFLKRELENDFIHIEAVKAERKQAPVRKMLSPDEQLELLSQKYPLLEELRRRLDLDFE